MSQTTDPAHPHAHAGSVSTGAVQSVASAITGVTKALDPNLLCLVLLQAGILAAFAWAIEQHRAYQHTEMMTVVRVCTSPGRMPAGGLGQ